jgi:hypothetical protein
VFAVVSLGAQAAPPVPPAGSIPTRDSLRGALEAARAPTDSAADRLLALRAARIGQLVHRNRAAIELDAAGNPARKGEILVVDASPVALATLANLGFVKLSEEPIAALDLSVTRLSLPASLPLRQAGNLIADAAPGLQWTADNLYFALGESAAGGSGATARAGRSIETTVGVIDGAPAAAVPIAARRGFARGAPYANDHASEVASLLKGAGVRRVLAADVFGRDAAGGNALAIAEALGWLLEQGAKVVTIPLVGPDNLVLARAVAAAQARGVVIVAPVGDDGPAAPVTYPASYDAAVAITAVDGRGDVLAEAGRALHVDYAAPGAALADGARGTAFAAALAAGRIAAALDNGDWRPLVDSKAVDLGNKGADPVYGRGVVCADCR